MKQLFGLALSKSYVFVLFGFIYGLDQTKSDGFSCRNLKDGTGFLLSNRTEPAEYLNKTFTQIWEMRKENGRGLKWLDGNQVNGLLSDWNSEYGKMWGFDSAEFTSEMKFSQAADLIESFNLRGFHDVCNVLTLSDVTLWYLPPWFESRNATGTSY